MKNVLLSGTGRTTCPFYEEIYNILCARAASSPPVLLDSSAESQVTVSERLDESGKLCKIVLIVQIVKNVCFPYTVAITDDATSGVDATEPDLESTDSFRQTTQEPSPSNCSASGESGDGQTRRDKITA